MRHANKQLALNMGIDKQRVLLPDNGQITEMYDDIIVVSEKK